MYIKVIIVLCVGIVWANEDFERIDSIHQEDSCSSRGGSCTIAEDCPDGSLSEERGLCPNQRSIGVECCYGVSVKETRCHKRGGSCLPSESSCNQILKIHNVTDCPKETSCCLLV